MKIGENNPNIIYNTSFIKEFHFLGTAAKNLDRKIQIIKKARGLENIKKLQISNASECYDNLQFKY